MTILGLGTGDALFLLLVVPPSLLWCSALWVALRVRRAIPELRHLNVPSPKSWPRLSVIVPARDEALDAEAAARSRLATDYPEVELVLVNDRSSDETGGIFDRLAETDARVKAVHVRELPEGWLGKVWAMQKGLDVANGEWILFTDADVHLSPDALRRAVAWCESRKLDHLTALPQLPQGGWLLDAAFAAFGRLFSLGTRMWEAGDPESKTAIGVGAFNLVRRTALDRIGGMKHLQLDVADDVMLAVLLKQSGARAGVVNGRRAVMLDWYRSLPEMMRGLEKGLYAYAGRCQLWRMLMVGTLALLLEAAPWVGLFVPHGWIWLKVLCGLALISGIAASILTERWMGRSARTALTLPLGGLILFTIFVRAGWLGWRRGGVLWRGRLYPTALLKEHMAREDR
jgi:glycosyltransferase involved in cell wall biosynthesis